MPLLAQLVVEYVADVSKLTNGVQSAANNMKSMENAANSGTNSLSNLSGVATAVVGTLAAVGGVAVGIGVASTKMAADFQSGITGLETSGNELHSNLQMVGDGILDTAVKTGTATKDLTSGMLQIESAGYHGADGLNVLTNAAEGAKTGQSNLKDVSNGLTTAMVDYHIPVSQAAETTNDLIATMKNGKTTMGELASSLKNVLPFASSAGISLKDVSAAMSTLTSQGIPAGQSATFLKTMILSLEAPSSKGAATLKSIGLSAQDVATKMKTSLPGALEMITNQLKTKFPEGSAAYTSALKDITGGSSSLAAVLGLTGDNMTTFKNNVDNIAGSVKAGGDSIQGWATTQGDFNQKMDQAREVVETLGIKLGQKLLPAAGQLLDKITPLISKFGDWLINSGALQNTTNLLGTAISTLATWIGNVVTVGTQVVNFFKNNQLAMDGLKAVAIGVAAAFLAFAIVSIPAVIAAFGAMAVAAWASAAPVLVMAAPFVAIGLIVAAVVFGIILAVQHWGQIVAWLSGVWGAFSGWFMGMLGMLGAWFSGLWGGIITGLTTAWAFIINAVKVAALVLLAIIFAPIIAIAGMFIWLYQHNIYFQMLVDAIVNFFKGCFAWLQGAWTATISWLGGAWNGLVGMAQAAWGDVSGAIKTGFSAAIGFVSWVWGQISSFFVNAWSTYIANPLHSLWTNVSNVFSSAWGTYIAGPIGSLWNSISTTVGGWAGKAVDWGKNLIQGFIDGITGMLGAVGKAAGDIAGKVAQFLGFHSPTELGVGAEADNWAPNFVNMYSKGLINGIPQIQDAVDNLVKPVAIGIKGAPSSIGATSTKSKSNADNNRPIIIEDHTHHHVHMDGREVTDIVMTNAVKAARRGPIRSH